jgi:hypothetical protein
MPIVKQPNMNGTVLYTGTYTRTGKETYSIYQIKTETSSQNFSQTYQIWNFKLTSSSTGTPIPLDYVYFFVLSTQRIDSYSGFSVLEESISLTIQENGNTIGTMLAQSTYPDKGSGSVSSSGTTLYPVITTSGLLEGVSVMSIQFFDDAIKSRIVKFYKSNECTTTMDGFKYNH